MTLALSTKTVWQLTEEVLNKSSRVLLHSVPGLGKTYIATTYGLKANQEVHSITITPETPAAELRGFYVPRGSKFVWQDGPAITAWRNGGRLVLNEIDRASGDLLSLLLAICDDPEFARLTLPNNETVKPAPGFCVVATMNASPDDLDTALLDRFPTRIHINQVSDGALAKIPQDLRDFVLKTAILPDAARRVSYRSWFEYAQLREIIGANDALSVVFGNRAKDILNSYLLSKA